MSSTIYQRQTHRTSWDATPSRHKYSTEGHYYETPQNSRQPSSISILKTIRNSLCRIFGSQRGGERERGRGLGSRSNDSVDSLAYAESDDSFEAESMDEDNIAWGKPATTRTRRSWLPTRRSRSGTRTRRDKEKEESSSIPHSPDSVHASCRLW